MIIKKLSESISSSTGGFNVNQMLSEFKMTIRDFDSMLDKLNKYKENLVGAEGLIEDLIDEKKANWVNLRKWKVTSMLSRWEIQKSKINEVDQVEDYVTEMQDEGWKVSVNTRNSLITFRCTDHPIAKMSVLFTFLSHNKRLGFRLKSLEQNTSSVTVKVEYKVRPKAGEPHVETTDDRIKNSAEDEDRLEDVDDTAERIRRILGQ